jgi:hypothetical protein
MLAYTTAVKPWTFLSSVWSLPGRYTTSCCIIWLMIAVDDTSLSLSCVLSWSNNTSMVDGVHKVSYTFHFYTLQAMVPITVHCEGATECSMLSFILVIVTRVAYHMEKSWFTTSESDSAGSETACSNPWVMCLVRQFSYSGFNLTYLRKALTRFAQWVAQDFFNRRTWTCFKEAILDRNFPIWC